MRWLGGVLGCLWLVQAWAEPEAGQLLQRMQQSQQANYQGSFIYERKDVFSSHRMWRFTDEQGHRRERFLQLSGPRLEVLRVDGRVSCVLQPQDEHFAAQNWPVQNLDWEQLGNWYSLRVLGESRVADRVALALLFAPLDEHRYPLELHLDKQTAVPLKSLLLNEHGQLLERFQFVNFAVDDVQAQDLKPGSPQCRELKKLKQSVGDYSWQWQLGWLPDGFAPVHEQVQSWQAGEQQVSRQTYTDGLAQFSVFVAALSEQDVASARIQMGPTVVVSRRMETAHGVFMLTVLGEIPVATAERLAQSISLQGGE